MSNNDFQYQPGRVGILAASRFEPLQAPYILWDSRSWDGGAQLINEGSSGSEFDLWVDEQEDGGVFHTIAKKQRNWDAITDTGPHPTTWSDVSGTPCDGAFTTMIALHPDWGLESEVGLYRPVEVDCLLGDYSGVGIQLGLFQNWIFDNAETYTAPPFPHADWYSGFYEWYTRQGDTYCQWLQENLEPGYGPGQHDPSGKLITAVADPYARQFFVWVDDHLVLMTDLYSDEGSSDNDNMFVQFDFNNCYDGISTIETASQSFLYFGGDVNSSPSVSGQAWNPTVGAAFFRGKPSKSDLTYWKNFFLDDLLP